MGGGGEVAAEGKWTMGGTSKFLFSIFPLGGLVAVAAWERWCVPACACVGATGLGEDWDASHQAGLWD